MSDVRAAEERMRAWLALPEPKGITDRHYDGGVGQYDIDSEILVNAYLAEHPADDDVEILRRERDEAREAARTLHRLCVEFDYDTDDDFLTVHESTERWPWLREAQ